MYIFSFSLRLMFGGEKQTPHMALHVSHSISRCYCVQMEKIKTSVQYTGMRQGISVCLLPDSFTSACLLARIATHYSVWVCVHFLECRPSFELDSFNFYVIYHLGFSLTSFLTFQFPIHGAAVPVACAYCLCYVIFYV